MKDFFRTNMLIIVAAFSVIAKIISGQNIFLILFLILSCYGIFKVGTEYKIIYLLFFSSWIYVLKFNAESFSVFNILQLIYILSCLLSVMINENNFNLKVIFGFLFFVFYTILNSIIISGSGLFNIMGFILNFMTIVLALSTFKSMNTFKYYVYYYATGILFSGFVALLGNWIPKASEQIQSMGESYTIYQNNHLYTRFSGLDIDPNYFSFQVLFAIALLIVISRYKESHLKENILILILAFMGINTLSKMFLTLLIFIIVYTCIFYLNYKLTIGIKYILTLTVVILAMLPLGLLDFIRATLYRFSGQGKSVVSVTTGRSDIWVSYIQEIFSNPRVFLIGNGIGSGFFEGFAAHNMYLSYWYFTGLIGIIVLLLFVLNSYRQIKKQVDVKNKKTKLGLNKLPLIILIIANFALDSILMNFFPYLLYLTILAGNYICVSKVNSIVIDVKQSSSNKSIESPIKWF